MTADPMKPRTYLFAVAVRDDDGGGPGYNMSFGDGTYERQQLVDVACAAPLVESRISTPLEKTLRFTHTYDDLGDYDPGIEVITTTGCDGQPDERAVAHLDLRVN